MSGKATGWVLEHGPKDRALRMVLLVIADAANAEGHHAHPGMRNLVNFSLYSERTVQAALAQLELDKWIEVEEEGGGRGKATVYMVRMETPQSSHPLGQETPQKPRDLERETPQSTEPSLFGSTDTTSTSPKPPRKRPTTTPEAFEITEHLREWAIKAGASGIDLAFETQQFLNWHASKGNTFVDWSRAWQTWIGREVKKRGATSSSAPVTGGLSQNCPVCSITNGHYRCGQMGCPYPGRDE